MLVFFSFFPIALLIFLMTKKKAMASYQALPLVALLTYGLMIVLFKHPLIDIHANVIAGFLTSWTPILIIWGAIFLFRVMDASGSMKVVRTWLNSVSDNKVAQLMIVGWAFPFLIEGASGFGTPAALAAPILVGLGFNPLLVAIMVLINDTIPVTFGAVGTPTWFGFSAIDLSVQQISEIGIKSAYINGVASLVIPVLALRFVVTWKEIKDNLLYVYLSILSTMIPYVVIAHFDYEFPSLAGGFIGILGSVFIAQQGWGLQKTEKIRSGNNNALSVGGLVKAGFALWGTLLLLIITRVQQFGIKHLLTSSEPSASLPLGGFGTIAVSPALVVSLKNILGTSVNWSHKLLYVPSLIPFGVIALITAFLYQMKRKDLGDVFAQSVSQVKYPAIALFGALIFVNLMMMGGDASAVNKIGQSLASATGGGWYYFAAVLGAVGSFFSGSNTISNLTFGPIQYSIANDLGLNTTTVLALQSVGGAMGNMVCINNIVAVCSVLAITNKEGYILTRTVRVLIPYAVIAALVSFLL